LCYYLYRLLCESRVREPGPSCRNRIRVWLLTRTPWVRDGFAPPNRRRSTHALLALEGKIVWRAPGSAACDLRRRVPRVSYPPQAWPARQLPISGYFRKVIGKAGRIGDGRDYRTRFFRAQLWRTGDWAGRGRANPIAAAKSVWPDQRFG